MSPAVLICGAPGTGKATLARLLAQGLLCTAPGDRPCGVCKSCLRVMRGTHPDCLTYTLTPKDKSIKVEDHIRPLLKLLDRHPLEGERRAVLLPHAEMMTAASQNALLKSLEETQEGTWFLLTADNENSVLPTIRSRCRLIRLPPFKESEIRRALEDEGISAPQAELAASLSEGSLTAARALAAREDLMQLKDTAVRQFLSCRGLNQYARQAAGLRNVRDQADDVLWLMEQEVRLLMRRMASGEPLPDWAEGPWENADPERCRRVLGMILETQRMRRFNVGAQGALDNLIQQLSEETDSWQT